MLSHRAAFEAVPLTVRVNSPNKLGLLEVESHIMQEISRISFVVYNSQSVPRTGLEPVIS